MRSKLIAAITAGIVSASTVAPSLASDSMAVGENGYKVLEPLFTVGETINGYTPPGILDGLGATRIDKKTVRVLSNHELLNFRGYPYTVNGDVELTGARISYFDIDIKSKKVVNAGLAYDTVYDADGNVRSDNSFLAMAGSDFGFSGFSRFCSSALFEKGQYGLKDTIYFTGEEDGGFFNSVGGGVWALDVKNNDFWHVPDLGRGAWENLTLLNTGRKGTVAVLLADDTSPFDFDEDGEREASPLYLYIGKKNPYGDFLERNGLRGGKLHVFVPFNGAKTPLDFNTKGSLKGKWVEVDNSRDMSKAGTGGRTGYDDFGYPTQGNLFLQSKALGAFGFSRPEDVSTNPYFGKQAVLASTGVDTYAIDEESGNGADTFGTLYTVTTNFYSKKALVRILYDGDADPSRALRSPDNLDWSPDGFIYVQEDEAEEDTASGDEVLFGNGAANPNEASIVRVSPYFGKVKRVASVDRSVVLDPTTTGTPVDVDAGDAGEWETSGILDVSKLFYKRPGSLFIFNVQAHGIEDQEEENPDSRINDDDLVEGGQLLFLSKKKRQYGYGYWKY